MSYRTVEVELENGRVRPRGKEDLPAKAHALLTILESPASKPLTTEPASNAGLRRFLSEPDFPLTAEQFTASMEADFWEQ
jgi:hypothetical protein